MSNVDQSPSLAASCAALRGLHRRGQPLVLPNAWDVASAAAVVRHGFAAVATSSGAVAAVLGFADHEGAPGEAMLTAAARIAATVAVPVTVDAERGYGWSPEELVARLRDAGAAGANLEDTDHRREVLHDLDEQASWLADVRHAAAAIGYPLVLNARVDVFIAGRNSDPAELVDEAVRRSNAYLAAGADCVYPILLGDPPSQRRLIDAVDGPVNLLSHPGGQTVRELAALGAARISFGTSLHRATMSHLDELLDDIAAGAAGDA